MRRKAIFILIVVATFAVCAVGVVQRDYLGAVARQMVGGESSTTSSHLIVGTGLWPGYEPLYLARDRGYFEDDRIHLAEFPSATQTIRAFRNGTIHVAALTLDEVLLLRQSGLHAQVFLVMDVSMGGDVILAKPEIDSLGGLRGRRVGFEDTALGAYVLTRALQEAGMALDDVILVPVEFNKHEQVFEGDEVDAVVTFEPTSSRLLAGGARQVFDSSQIPDEIIDVLVVMPDTLRTQPEQIQGLLDGWFRALRLLNDHPSEAAADIAKRLDLSAQEVIASYQGLHLPTLDENLTMLTGPDAPLRAIAERMNQVMVQAKLLSGEVDLDGLCAPQALQIRDSRP